MIGMNQNILQPRLCSHRSIGTDLMGGTWGSWLEYANITSLKNCCPHRLSVLPFDPRPLSSFVTLLGHEKSLTSVFLCLRWECSRSNQLRTFHSSFQRPVSQPHIRPLSIDAWLNMPVIARLLMSSHGINTSVSVTKSRRAVSPFRSLFVSSVTVNGRSV